MRKPRRLTGVFDLSGKIYGKMRTPTISIIALRRDVRRAADPAKAKILARFFKTGPGEYGAGDKFLGLTVPVSRAIVRKYHALPLADVKKLLASPNHEERLIALLVLVEQFQKGGKSERKKIFDLYLASTARINSWDLVDLSADKIVGAYLNGRGRALLTRLARSKHLWERRIAMLATFHRIKQGDATEAFRIAKTLLRDRHDLIHKAVGWMLREAGKRSSERELRSFLDTHAGVMPRTTLRYAIERLPERERRAYLARR